MSITSVVNDNIGDSSFINAQKPIPPTITNYAVSGSDDTALLPAGGQTVLINGTGFLRGATVSLSGTAIGVVTWVSANQLSFVSPAKTAGTYTLYVVNSDGGTAIYIPGLIYSTNPTWTTAAGSLGSYYETQAISNTVVATDDTGSAMTYSLASGSLPSGATLYANGLISGTAPVDSGSTTYSFTIDATDTTLQSTSRSFSLTINTDVVTWVNPSNGATITLDGTAYSNVLVATDAAGYSIASYAANALPTGLTLSGNTISGTPTTAGSTTTLLTATAATTNRNATNTITWVVSLSDIYWNYVTLLLSPTLAALPFNDDASTNNFNITVNGDTRPSNYSPYEPGYYSNFFDGTGDYLTVPNNINLTIGSGDFTIECWVYITGAQTTTYGYAVAGPNTGQGSSGWGLVVNRSIDARGFGFVCQNGFVSNNSTYLAVGQWHHLAVTRSGSGANNLKLFINGVISSQTTYTTTDTYTASPVYIGADGLAGQGFPGYISNFRFVSGTAVYTAAFTPSTTPLSAISGTSLLTCQSNRFIDTSTNNYTVTRVGDTTVNPFVPFVPSSSYATYGSGYFDGTGDYLSVPDNEAFNYTGDFTIECWLYPTSHPANVYLIGQASSTDYAPVLIALNSGRPALAVSSNGSTWTINGFIATALTLNTWSHVATVRNGNKWSIYVNGVENVIAASTAVTPYNSTDPLGIGSEAVATINYPYVGYISDLRIVKGTAVYTANFTPPTAPLTAITNTSLLTLQNNQPTNNSMFLDSGTLAFPITRAGNTTQGSFTPYSPSSWSGYFDGNGDYLSNTGSTAFTFGTSNFTVEYWVYVTSEAASYNQHVGCSSTSNGFSFGGVGTGKMSMTTNTVGYTSNGPSFSYNQWNHFAYVRSSGTVTFYLNGAVNYTTAANTNITETGFGIGATASGTFPMTGYISNLRVVKGTAVYTAAFTPSTTPLNAIANTSLLTLQDNRFIDDSINNFTITRNGDARVTNFNPFGSLTQTAYYSNFFDGDGDYLTIPESTPLNISTGDFTIEAWVSLRAMPTTDTLSTWQNWMVIYERGTINASDGWQFQIGQTLLMFSDSFGTSVCSGTHGMVINSWYHLAVSRSGNTFRVFVNGTQVGTSTSAITLNSGVSYWIGTETGQGAYLNGYISNLRVVKGTAVYTANFTPSTTPLTAISGTQLLTCQSATFIDNSTNNFTLTVTGTPYPKIISPFTPPVTTGVIYSALTNGASGYFDGTGDFLTLLSNQLSFTMGTGNFTIEMWVYVTSLAATRTLYDTMNSGDGTGTGRFAMQISTGGTIQIFTGAGSVFTSGGTVTVGSWNHIAYTKNSNSGRLYLNGIQVNSTYTDNNNYVVGTTNRPIIGINAFDNSSNPMLGYISDLRVVKGQALYTSQFVPPVQALTAVQNTVFLSSFGYGAIVDSSCENNLETVADAKVSTAVVKYGNTSMFFDGTGDYMYPSGSGLNFTFGTGNFTIEMWCYFNSTSGNIYDGRPFQTNGVYPVIYITGGSLRYYVSSADRITSGSTLSTGIWYHIALSRSGTSTRMFIDGTQTGSTYTDSNNYLVAAGRPVFGVSTFDFSSSALNAYLSDVRVTNGVARYTANFTAPTSAFQRN